MLCSAFEARSQVAVDRWTTENGLPQNIVRAVCQAPEGYLWIATFDGLVRFDGVRFVTFNRSNTPGIEGNRFTSLLCLPNGDLWAGTEGSGLTRYSNGIFRTYTVRDGLSSENASGVTGDHNGNVWVLAGGQISRWRPEQQRFVALAGNRAPYSDSLTPDGRMGFWQIDEAGLHIFANGVKSDYALPPGWPTNAGLRAGTDPNGHLFVSGGNGRLAQLVSGRWRAAGCSSASQSACTAQRSFPCDYLDAHGHGWHSDIRWDSGDGIVRELILPKAVQPRRIAFNTLFEDRESNIWLSTDGQGLYRIRRQNVTVYSQEQGLPGRNIYPLCQTHDGAIWIGTWDRGLCRLEAGKCTNYAVENGLASNRTNAIFQDRDDVLWVAVENGLHQFRKNRFERVDPPSFISLGSIRAIYQTPDGVMWFGGSTGLIRKQNDQWSVLTRKEGLATNDVRVITRGRKGNLWIGGYGGLSSVNGVEVRAWTTADGLASNTIRTLYEDAAGVLWIGTYDGGLSRFENGKFTRYTEKQGLFNNGVFQILEDDRARLWMSCNRGIYRVEKKQLNELAAGRTNSISSVAYGKYDGMRNAECNGGLGSDGIKARDGRLWFATQDGVVVIDPEKLSTNPAPPPVVIESFLIDRKPVAFRGLVRIPPGHDTIEIQYTGLNFLDPQRIHFRVRLDPIDKEWVEEETHRSTLYAHLPPGTYTFHVSAAQGDGLWSKPKTAVFTVIAPFYLRSWFTASWLGIASLILYQIWRYRLRRLEREKAAQRTFSRQLIASQETERKRIAGELHDTIGQRLAIVKNLAAIALDGVVPAPNIHTQFQEISSEASQAISELRQISYNLRPYQLDRFGLVKALETMIKHAAAASGIDFIVSMEDIDGVFEEQGDIGFYRILQEAVNNILKHSHASKAEVIIRSYEDKVSLLVRDNGIGCSLSDGTTDPGFGGFGLVGVSERAELLGGRLVFDSKPGQGTTLSIDFMLPSGNTAR